MANTRGDLPGLTKWVNLTTGQVVLGTSSWMATAYARDMGNGRWEPLGPSPAEVEQERQRALMSERLAKLPPLERAERKFRKDGE